jgi:hypothetical protein
MMYDLLVERMLNGLAKNKTINDLAKKHKVSVAILKSQLKKGITVEKEHTKNSNVAKKIAMDHLFENPKYYNKLKKIETVKRKR